MIGDHRLPQIHARMMFLMSCLAGSLTNLLVEASICFNGCCGINLFQLWRRLLNLLGTLTGCSAIKLGLVEFLKKLGDEKTLCEVGHNKETDQIEGLLETTNVP
jgi:hypothetical protein